MLSKKKVAGVLLGAMLGLSGSAFAAGADGLSDVPKDHWSYEALDYLAKNGIIEGMGDGTFQGNRTMTRYEMAAIVYRALQYQGGDFGTKSVLERLKAEYGSEIDALKNQVAQNTKDIAELKENNKVKLYGFVRAQWDSDNDRHKEGPWESEKTNNRFLLDLKADLKVSDQWTGHFQIETNQRYARADSQDGNNNRTTSTDKISNKDWGTVQRVWLTGNLPHGIEVNAGRRWAPLGHQFSLLGATVNGVDATMPLGKSGMRIGGFYYNMAEYDEADFSFWGPIIKGKPFKNFDFDIQMAYAKLNVGREAQLNVPYGVGKGDNFIGNKAFVVSFSTPVVENIRFTGDYAQTNHVDTGEGKNNKTYMARLDYKWTNPSVRKSFGAYIRYHYIGKNGTIWSDDSWSSIPHGSKGWTFGFRYVPWKQVVWETMYIISDRNFQSWNPYKRRLVRTQLDFCF